MHLSDSMLIPPFIDTTHTSSTHVAPFSDSGQNLPFSHNVNDLQNSQAVPAEYQNSYGSLGQDIGMPLEPSFVEYSNSYGSLGQDVEMPLEPGFVEYSNSFGSLNRDMKMPLQNSHENLNRYPELHADKSIAIGLIPALYQIII